MINSEIGTGSSPGKQVTAEQIESIVRQVVTEVISSRS
jgi:hypothetical protein